MISVLKNKNNYKREIKHSRDNNKRVWNKNYLLSGSFFILPLIMGYW
jgi:hypothetical protein